MGTSGPIAFVFNLSGAEVYVSAGGIVLDDVRSPPLWAVVISGCPVLSPPFGTIFSSTSTSCGSNFVEGKGEDALTGSMCPVVVATSSSSFIEFIVLGEEVSAPLLSTTVLVVEFIALCGSLAVVRSSTGTVIAASVAVVRASLGSSEEGTTGSAVLEVVET